MQDTAGADAILKNYYLPVVREMINQRAILLFGYSPAQLEAGFGTMNAANGETMNYQGISRDGDRVQFAGRQWVIPLHTSRNESGTARDEGSGGVLPAAGQQGWTDILDKVRRFYKQIQLTGFSIELSEKSIGSYLALLQTETEGAVTDLRKDMNRQAYGDQTGAIAAVLSEGSNTITVDNLQYLRVGMFIDLIDSTNDTALAQNRKITAINPATRLVTYSGADVTATTNHRVCVEGNWKKEINGLKNIIRSDLYPTLHSVNSSTAGNEWWKGKFVDGGNSTLDEDLAQQLLDSIGAEGYETEMLIGTRGIRRRYVNTLKAQKRFNDSSSGMLHGGFKYIDFDGIPLLADDDAPKQNLWFLEISPFLWVTLNDDFRWMDRDGAVLRKVENPDLDAYKATLYKYCDLGCWRRKCEGVMYNLADDIP